MSEPIPLAKPEFYGDETVEIKEALDAGEAVGGWFTEQLEMKASFKLGAAHAVALTSGSAALHLSLLVAGIGPDDEVIVPDITFMATASAVKYVGAQPLFMDVDPETWQMDLIKLNRFLLNECFPQEGYTVNKSSGSRIKAIIAVHLLGIIGDMRELRYLCDDHGILLIEDAAEALGGRHQGRSAGNLGDLSILSFNANKVITGAGGGMLLTSNEEWAEKARLLANHGKLPGPDYRHDELGYNYRMSNIQAALLSSQWVRLADHLNKKLAIHYAYAKDLMEVHGVGDMPDPTFSVNTFWLSAFTFGFDDFGMTARKLRDRLAKEKIESRLLFEPLHRSPVFQDCRWYQIEAAPQLYENVLTLPSSVGLTGEEQNRVIDVIKEAQREAW